ncbi:hypothetical protein [Candidatus Villigracilis affinis]|uniref:hypothetical protein n=1 Tax=Candidatus Villigracilis affinis TaxID=3140682 RepID=UPI002A1C5A76|nr:hypothetical protein [Anaerolineales bacterium]
MRALVNIQLPLDDNEQYIDTKEFHQILQLIGLRPRDMPPSDDEQKFKEYCLRRAGPVFDRMPENTEEEKARKQHTKENIVYASDLPQSNTIFMVTAHTESECRFRLLNPKIESLQEGAKDLVLKINHYNEEHPNKPLKIVGKIDIFEHGLEESTISGIVVKNRWDATKTIAGRDILISFVGLVLFFILTSANIFLTKDGTILHTIVDRLSTAMFTAMIVSVLTVYYAYRSVVPVIQWTASYENKF